MKKGFYLILLLLVCVVIQPPGYLDGNSYNLDPGFEYQTLQNVTIPGGENKQFVTAGEGDESTDSIYSFSETSDDDSYLFPDYDLPYIENMANITDWTLGSGESWSSDGEIGTWVITGDGGWDNIFTNDIALTVGTGSYVEYRIRTNETTTSAVNGWLFGYTEDNKAGDQIAIQPSRFYATTVFTTYKFECNAAGAIESLMLFFRAQAGRDAKVEIDFLLFDDSPAEMGELDYIYAEGMTNVTDWAEGSINEGAETISSDDDIMTIACDGNGNNDADYFYSTISVPYSDVYIIEIRSKVSDLTADSYKLYISDAFDGVGGLPAPYKSYTLTESTTWTTDRFVIDKDWTEENGVIGATILTVLIRTQCDNGISPSFYVEYILISPSDETGFSYDMSLDETVDTRHLSEYNGEATSDGDKITFVQSGANARLDIFFDYAGAGTYCLLDPDYYPMVEFKITAVLQAFSLGFIHGNGTYEILESEISSIGTYRYNIKGTTSNDYMGLTIDAVLDSVTLDWGQAFGIANYTYSQGSAGINDYAYTNGDNNLIIVNDVASYQGFKTDWALSVAKATYQVFNISVANPNGVLLRETASSASWHTEDDTTGLITSTTLTQFVIYNYDSANTLSISAIKFWTDTVDPVIEEKFVTPNEPTENDDVTVTVIVSDNVDVWKVVLNAVTYPVGFTDQDYRCTRELDDTLYSYTFEGMTPGYYIFSITLNDGQGFDLEYLPFTVTVDFVLTIQETSNTFDHVTISGTITKNAAYIIYDSDGNIKQTGSVVAGNFTLTFEMWNKRSLARYAYDIRFANGSSILWFNHEYYADDPEEYKGGGVVTQVPWWQDPMTWVLIGGVLALIFIITSGQKTGKIPNAPKELK